MPHYRRPVVPGKRKARPKSVQVINDFAQGLTNSTLYSWELNMIDRATTDSLVARQGVEVYVSGIKLDMFFKNSNLNSNKFLRIMILEHRGDDSTTTPLDQSTQCVPDANFYRSVSGPVPVNFAGVTRSGWSRLYHDVNTDAWNILYSKTHWLPGVAQKGATTDVWNHYGSAVSNWFKHSFYVPYGRVIQYDLEAPISIPTRGRLFLVVYFDEPDRAAGVANISTVQTSISAVNYFHDVH